MNDKIITVQNIDIVFDIEDINITEKIREACNTLGKLTREAAKRGLVVTIEIDNSMFAIAGLILTPMVLRPMPEEEKSKSDKLRQQLGLADE
ncbi:MAG: hypothetical protein LBR94_08920 [Desulfovibrio sp.]|jgi:hypothetical protein|nr:hypothetical protein [Desulfovibrio sp.]